MIIELTKELIEKARTMEAETLKNLPNRPNYTGMEFKDRYFIGYLGELAFEQCLKNLGKKYIYEPKTDGKSHGEDFVVYAHRPLTVEIKTRSQPISNIMLIPAKQFVFKTCDIYIAIKIETNAHIIGYCFKNDFSYTDNFYKTGKKTYLISYTKLYPIADFMAKLAT